MLQLGKTRFASLTDAACACEEMSGLVCAEEWRIVSEAWYRRVWNEFRLRDALKHAGRLSLGETLY